MKTYVITLSKNFLSTHPKAGEPTGFEDAVKEGRKIHTIRCNFPFWEKRIREVQNGKAKISLRQWTGKPYRSKQKEIAVLTAKEGVGIQPLLIVDLFRTATTGNREIELLDLAKNDGLTFGDWYYWFRGYDISQPLAIIHFTKFRYR